MKAQDLSPGQYFIERRVLPAVIGRKVDNLFVYFSYLPSSTITCEESKIWDDIEVEQIDYPTTLQLLIEFAAKENEPVPEFQENRNYLKNLLNGQWFITEIGQVGMIFNHIFAYLNDWAPYWGTIEYCEKIQATPVTKHQALLQALKIYIDENDS